MSGFISISLLPDYKGDVYTLKKTSGTYKEWTPLLEKVVSFGIQGNFMYASTLTDDVSLFSFLCG